MFKKSLVAAFALAAAFTASAATVAEMGSSTLLRVGSRGASVVAVQKALNACNGSNLVTDGIFGRMTAAQFRAFQTAKNIKVDGIVGLQTKGELEKCSMGTTTPTTPTTPVVDAGCTAGAAFSSTTGKACSTTPTTPAVEGYVTDIRSDSTNRVSTVYESETNKTVAGINVTARLAEQVIDSVRVAIKNPVPGTTSTNLGQYITSVSLMDGATVLATLPVSALDRANDDTYTAQFVNVAKKVNKDSVASLSLAFNANGSVDTANVTAAWEVRFISIRTSSPNGVYVTNNIAPAFVTPHTDAPANTPGVFKPISVAKVSASGLKATVGVASSNPLASTAQVSTSAVTNNVKLLDFKVKAEISDMTLRMVPVTIAATGMTTPTNQTAAINTVKLMKGTELVDTLPASDTGTYSFSNLLASAAKIAKGTESTFSVVVDLKAQGTASLVYANGATLTASIPTTDVTDVAKLSIVDAAGNQVPTGNRTGSATGNAISLNSVGASVTYVSEAYTAPSVTGGDATIRLTYKVTAFGSDITFCQDGTATCGGTAITTTSDAATAANTYITSNDLTAQASKFTISSGSSYTFTMSRKYTPAAGTFKFLEITNLGGSAVSGVKTAAY